MGEFISLIEIGAIIEISYQYSAFRKIAGVIITLPIISSNPRHLRRLIYWRPLQSNPHLRQIFPESYISRNKTGKVQFSLTPKTF